MYSLFDLVNNVYHKRFQQVNSSELTGKLWMVNRFLSMDKDLLEVIAYVSRYFFVLGDRYYQLLFRVVPVFPAVWVKYVKPQVDSEQEVTKRLSKFLELSSREVLNSLKILEKYYSEQTIKEFVGVEYVLERKEEKK